MQHDLETEGGPPHSCRGRAGRSLFWLQGDLLEVLARSVCVHVLHVCARTLTGLSKTTLATVC